MTKKNNKKAQKKGKRKVPPQIKSKVLANNASPQPKGNGRRVRAAGPRRGVQPHHVRGVCSITDPFCPASKNSKWPDGTAGNTLTEQFRGNAFLTTSADGTGGIAFAGAAPFGYLARTTSTTTDLTFAATYTAYTGAATSMLATYGQEYRIVSFGVIARCVASATNASGIITLGTTGNVPVSTVLTFGQEYYDEVVMKAIQPGMEISWISVPKGTGARNFVALSTATAFPSDWSSLVIELSGCPAATAMVMVEWYVNVEFTLKPQMAIATLARQNPAKSVAAETAVSKVHTTLGSFIEGGVKQVEASIANHASSALSSLMDDPLESIASLFAMF
jgi:hypothetical protein